MYKFFMIIALLCFFSSSINAKEPWNAERQFPKAIVVDDGLSALRKTPSITSTCLRRLRTGRSIFIISTIKNREGIKYHFVAVTRRTRGYIDASALVSPSHSGDDARLMRLIENAEGIEKIVLAQTLVKNFPNSNFCPQALLAEGMTAELIAKDLSKKVSKHSPNQLDPQVKLERYLLNYSGLDKYMRLGINFELQGQSYCYNGAAYKRILAHYAKSEIALTASERLQHLLTKEAE